MCAVTFGLARGENRHLSANDESVSRLTSGRLLLALQKLLRMIFCGAFSAAPWFCLMKLRF